MLRCFAVAGSVMLAACASPSTWSERNAETGTVIVAFAADKSAGSFRAFDLGLRRADRAFATDLPYTLRGMDADRPDFQTDSETGVILRKRLPPGEYEIVDLIGDQGSFWWSKETRSPLPTAFRFVVAPGSTTYLGHFRVELAQANAQPALVISDESSADISRAKNKYPALGQVTIAVAGAGDEGSVSARSGALATP